MKDLKAHIALFVVAVVATVLTWNRDTVPVAERDLFVVWDHDTTDVRAIRYSNAELDLHVQRLTDQAGSFLWAIQTRGTDAPETMEYPVGSEGHLLVTRLAVLRVLRSLGTLSDEQRTRFGLADPEARLTVEFTGETRELIVGDSTFGSADRYALEPATGMGYVLSRHLVGSLALGDGSLRERSVHHFPVDEVAMVRIVGGEGRERTMSQTEGGEWTEPGSETPDAGFANFMDRVGQMAIAGYHNLPPPREPGLFLRVEYMDAEGDALGFVELLRDDLAERDSYYIRSETTRIVARAPSILAERVEQAVGDVF